MHENEKAPLTKSTHRSIAKGATKFTKAPPFKGWRCNPLQQSQGLCGAATSRAEAQVLRLSAIYWAAIPEAEYMGEAEIDDEWKAEGNNQ